MRGSHVDGGRKEGRALVETAWHISRHVPAALAAFAMPLLVVRPSSIGFSDGLNIGTSQFPPCQSSAMFCTGHLFAGGVYSLWSIFGGEGCSKRRGEGKLGQAELPPLSLLLLRPHTAPSVGRGSCV